MKVKTILNLASCTRYEIIAPNNYYYDVDYLRDTKDTYKDKTGERLTSFARVPASVLDSCVDMVSVNSYTKALTIYIKEG